MIRPILHRPNLYKPTLINFRTKYIQHQANIYRGGLSWGVGVENNKNTLCQFCVNLIGTSWHLLTQCATSVSASLINTRIDKLHPCLGSRGLEIQILSPRPNKEGTANGCGSVKSLRGYLGLLKKKNNTQKAPPNISQGQLGSIGGAPNKRKIKQHLRLYIININRQLIRH